MHRPSDHTYGDCLVHLSEPVVQAELLSLMQWLAIALDPSMLLHTIFDGVVDEELLGLSLLSLWR